VKGKGKDRRVLAVGDRRVLLLGSRLSGWELEAVVDQREFDLFGLSDLAGPVVPEHRPPPSILQYKPTPM
jgi:hypothetical protein